MPEAFDKWFEEAKSFAKSDLSGFVEFATQTVIMMTTMDSSEKYEVVDILLEKPKFRSVFESRRQDILEILYQDYITLGFCPLGLKEADLLLKGGFEFSFDYVSVGISAILPNLSDSLILKTIFRTLLAFVGLPENTNLLNDTQLEPLSEERWSVIAGAFPLLLGEVNADLAVFVFVHLGVFSFGRDLFSNLVDSKELETYDNTSSLFKNIETASRLTIFELKNSGLDRLHMFLEMLEEISRMSFKAIIDDLPVVSTSNELLETLKRDFSVESIRQEERMLEKMDRKEAIHAINEITEFAGDYLTTMGTLGDSAVIELVNLVQQIYSMKLRPLQGTEELVALLSVCKALLNKFYGYESLFALIGEICAENPLSNEVLSILTVDSVNMTEQMLSVTSRGLLESCNRARDQQYVERLGKELLELAAQRQFFSATALQSYIFIVEDPHYASVTRDIMSTSDVVDSFLYIAEFVAKTEVSDSHTYFRQALLNFMNMLAHEDLQLSTIALVLEVSMFFLNTHAGDVDEIFKLVFSRRLEQGATAFYELKGLDIGRVCLYLNESADVAALLCPCDLLSSNMKTVKTIAFLSLIESSKLDILTDIRCDLVKLVLDELKQFEKMCDSSMALAIIEELPYLAEFDKDTAEQLLKRYGKIVGNEANFEQGSEILERVTENLSNVRQIASLGNYVNIVSLKARVQTDPAVAVDAHAILQMANSELSK